MVLVLILGSYSHKFQLSRVARNVRPMSLPDGKSYPGPTTTLASRTVKVSSARFATPQILDELLEAPGE